MKKVCTILALCLFTVVALADKQVNGVVVDDKGEPVIGASIQVKGTSLGTITDFDGVFSLSVPDDAKTLVVSYVGMQSQEVAAKANVRVVMSENTEVIQEVVVTGYGNVSKGSFAGSAQAVNAESIEKKNSSEISKALAGEVAGVQVVNSSGQPGTNATIVIRGVGSLNGSTTPLYVVDGVTYDGDISSIDPGDIASTTVLKDATATSLYGSRGANGVIVITTKKGKSGDEGKIDVDVKYGGNMRLLPLYETIQSPEEFVSLCWQALYNQASVVSGQKENAAIKTANNLLYDPAVGLPSAYNLWQAAGKDLINPYGEDGRIAPSFNEGILRRPGYENLESWNDAIFRVGQKVDASVKFHGGNDKVSYYTSFGYLKDQGYYEASDFDRFNVRANVDYTPKKWLKANLNMQYSHIDFNNPVQDGGGTMNNGFFYVNVIPAIYPVYLRNADGTIATDSRTGGPAYDYGDFDIEGNPLHRPFCGGINPAAALRLDKDRQVQNEVDAKTSLEVKFYKDLKLTVNVGAHYYNNVASSLTNKYYGDAAGLGRIGQSATNLLTISAQQLLEYNKSIDEHSIRAMAGHETYYYRSEGLSGSKSGLADGESLELGNAVKMQGVGGSSSTYTMDSYLASVSYIYAERYGITANYRADGSSRYAKGHRWGHFGSVGASWNFTNESFLRDVTWLRDGKLRLSWGVLGNQISSLYAYTNLYALDNLNDMRGYVESSKGNQNLTWERTNTTDVGLEVSFGKWVDFELDYFYKMTDNMLMYRSVAPSLGYSSIPTNDAKMANSGVEFAFNVHAVDTRNVKLDIRLNGSHYKNKMLQMPVDYYDKNGEPVRMIMSGAMSLGHSMYDIYTTTYMGVDDEGNALVEAYYDTRHGGLGDPYTDEKTGATKYNYISSLYMYQQENPDCEEYLESVATKDGTYGTSKYIGKSMLPDLDGGIGVSLEAYGVTLDIATSYRIGGYASDGTYATLMQNCNIGSYNWHVDIRNSWTADRNDEIHALPVNQQIPRISNYSDFYDQYSSGGGTRFLTSNSFFSLNNIQIGYNLPKKVLDKMHFNKFNLYISASNLAIATARKGYNPMTAFAGSLDTHGYSPMSTIMGGIKFTF